MGPLREFSHPATSFIVIWCQGIHHVPLLAHCRNTQWCFCAKNNFFLRFSCLYPGKEIQDFLFELRAAEARSSAVDWLNCNELSGCSIRLSRVERSSYDERSALGSTRGRATSDIEYRDAEHSLLNKNPLVSGFFRLLDTMDYCDKLYITFD